MEGARDGAAQSDADSAYRDRLHSRTLSDACPLGLRPGSSSQPASRSVDCRVDFDFGGSRDTAALSGMGSGHRSFLSGFQFMARVLHPLSTTSELPLVGTAS